MHDGVPLKQLPKMEKWLKFQYLLGNFAKTGNPNVNDLPLWPLYSIKNEEILDVELNGKVVEKQDPRKARLDVAEKLLSPEIKYNQEEEFSIMKIRRLSTIMIVIIGCSFARS